MAIKKVFIAHSWSDVGLNIQTKAVTKKLSETVDVLFISQARIGQDKIIVNNRLTVLQWPNKRPNQLEDFLFLIKQIRKKKPEILIVHFGATNICMLAAWLLNVRYRVCWMHTLTRQYYLDTQKTSTAKLAIFFRKIAYRLATHVIVQNEHGTRDAIEGYNINSKKIFKIYNGINASIFENNKNVCMSIRYCGRLDNSKGVDILIKAFAKIYQKNKNVVLGIAGKGSEEGNIKAVVREEKLEDVVKFLGFLSEYQAATKFISDAYCLVVPSRTDNFPTVILEALSAGVPVIATRVGGVTEMIEDGKEGYLVESENVEALADAITRMVEDTTRRNRMAQQARITFAEKFSMEKHVENVVSFLNGLN